MKPDKKNEPVNLGPYVSSLWHPGKTTSIDPNAPKEGESAHCELCKERNLKTKEEEQMPVKKIKDETETKFCRNPEHNPPSHCLFTPGSYEHTCPGCGKVTTFFIKHGGSLSK